MRKYLASAMVVGSVMAFGVPAFAKTETLKGQIVDQTCYTKDPVNNKGVDHKMPADTKDCAIACAKKGAPVALLTSDGKVYTITGELAANKNEKLVTHLGHMVEVTGDVSEKDGKMMIAASTVKMAMK